MLERDDIFRFIESESAAAAATITTASLDTRVAVVSRLVAHGAHRASGSRAAVVGPRPPRVGGTERQPPPEEHVPDSEAALGAWFRCIWAPVERLDTLHTVPWDSPLGRGGTKTRPSGAIRVTRCRRRPSTVGTRNSLRPAHRIRCRPNSRMTVSTSSAGSPARSAATNRSRSRDRYRHDLRSRGGTGRRYRVGLHVRPRASSSTAGARRTTCR